MEEGRNKSGGNVVINICDVCINPCARQVEFDGESIGFTGMEFLLLHYLAVNRDRAVSRKELLDKVWGFENVVETRATEDMVKRIRKKLFIAGSKLKIETVWGFGFKIV